MKFTLSSVPAGIPTWFIARSHRFTTHTHWRTGALFADNKEGRHLGLVEAHPHDRYVKLTTRGPVPYNFFGLLRDGLEAMGFEFVVAPEYRLPMLNAVRIPAGLEDAPVRKRLLDEYNIEIGAGLGDFAGKVWRIGLMGCSSTPNHVNMLLAALRKIKQGG